MKTKRIVMYLPSTEPALASWVLLDDTNQVIQTTLQSPLSVLPGLSDNIPVYVIVPGSDVVLTEVTLPKLNRHQLSPALAFALEEQLIDDVSKLHFAVGDYQARGQFPVAIVSHAKMSAWLDTLTAANIQPAALIPSQFALPLFAGTWQGSIINTLVSIRTGQYSGFACDEANLATCLALTYQEASNKPDTLTLYHLAPPTQPISIHHLVVNDITVSKKEWLTHCAEWISAPYINLLQGNYQPKHSAERTKKLWLIAGSLMAGCLGIALFSNLISLVILKQQVAHIEQAINTIYQRNFPQATSIIAPRERMEQKLKKLAGDEKKSALLHMLTSIGTHLPPSGFRIENLDYRDNQANVTLSANNFDAVDVFAQALTAQGLVVKQQNATSSGSQVKTTLLIHAGQS